MSTLKLYLGLDVHKDSVMVAVLPEHAKEPTQVERLPNDPKKLRRLFVRLAENGEIHACYEASGAGYVLHRWMREWGFSCEVIAPSLIPTRAGDRRKNDRRDAIQLARLYRAGELVVIRIPTEAEERVRDLVRCRDTFRREILRSRQYIGCFLTRRGLIYRDGLNWTQKHFAWMRSLLREGALQGEDVQVFSEYLSLLEYKIQRRDELDRKIEEIALRPAYKRAVERLRAFRGIDTHAAVVLASEIVDWRRFESPRQLMAYLGLVPSEHSTGGRERRGKITKTGNSFCRHVLVQAGWCYRLRPCVSTALGRRQQGQPPEVVAHAWKAQQRLYKLYHRIATRKTPQIAVVAVARELVGFLWAVMRELEMETSADVRQAA